MSTVSERDDPIVPSDAEASAQEAIPPRKKKHKKKPLPLPLHYSAYGAVRSISAAANIAGIEPSMHAMAHLGNIYAHLPINRARLMRAEENIQWCFPDWDASRVRATAMEAYRHLFCLGAEIGVTPRLLTQDGYAAFIELGELDEALQTLLSGQPCVMITGHCGNWELLGYTLALLGFPVHALYRPLDLKPLDEWLHQTRSRRGLTLVDKFGASEVVPGIVERGEPVGFIADQNAGDRGLFVPFFDRLASAYKTIGLLAMKFDAPVLCGHAVRMSGTGGSAGARFRYRVDVVDLIRPEDWRDQPDPLYYITARYRRAIEEMVRRAPEQYLWMHRYWKSRPRHERLGRPFPDALREKIAALPWMTPERVERVVERSAQDAAAWAAGKRK